MSKTDLRARPMFARTEDAIEAHLTIVFAALAVSREVQTRTGLALRNVLRQLRPLRSATIAINSAVQTIPPAISDEQQTILDALTRPESRTKQMSQHRTTDPRAREWEPTRRCRSCPRSRCARPPWWRW